MPRPPTLRIWIGMRSKSTGEAGLARCITTSTGAVDLDALLTSCSTKVKPGRCDERARRCAASPVTRLSTATTSSPRSSSASQRCEPRNPAPPVTTTRRHQLAADAAVLEAAPRERGPVEQVAGVDDLAGGHQVRHLVDVEPAELVPLGEHDEHLGALDRGVRVVDHLDALESGPARRPGRTPGSIAPRWRRRLEHRQRRRLAQVVGAGLEREAPRGDALALDRAAGQLDDLLGHPVELLVVHGDDALEEVEVVARRPRRCGPSPACPSGSSGRPSPGRA